MGADALMFREIEPDTVWEVRLVPVAKLPQFEGAGWQVLIAAEDLQPADRAPTFNSLAHAIRHRG